jgi:hypothetical protein
MNKYEQILKYLQDHDTTSNSVYLTLIGIDFIKFLAEIFPTEALRKKQKELKEIKNALQNELKEGCV